MIDLLGQLADNKLVIGLIVAVFAVVLQRIHEVYKKQLDYYAIAKKPDEALAQQLDNQDHQALSKHANTLSDAQKKQYDADSFVYRAFKHYIEPQHKTTYQSALKRLNHSLAQWLDKQPFDEHHLSPQHFFTESSFRFCLRLAFIYPIALLVLSWLLGDVGKIGELKLLSNVSLADKLLSFFALLIMAFCYYVAQKAKRVRALLWLLAFLVITVVTGNLTVVDMLAGAMALAITGTIAGASTLAATGSLVVALTSINLTSSAFFLAVAIVISKISDHYDQKMEMRRGLFWSSWLTFFTLYSVAAIVLILTYATRSSLEVAALPIFLGILPLLNSVIDWCSLNVSRYLFAQLSHTPHAWLKNSGFIVLDIALAIGFMLLITGVLISVLTATNWLAQTFTNTTVFNFSVIMQDLKNPAELSNMLWVHGMLLSTIIPTVVHIIFVIFAFCFTDLWQQKTLSIDAFYAHADLRLALPNKVLWAKIFTVVITIVVLWILFIGLQHFTTPLEWLWDFADGLLQLMDSTYESNYESTNKHSEVTGQ